MLCQPGIVLIKFTWRHCLLYNLGESKSNQLATLVNPVFSTLQNDECSVVSVLVTLNK